jgi:hypothetical protein
MRPRHRRWSSDEDLQLQQLRASGAKWAVIAKKLRKTEAATISRAGYLGLQAVR